MPELVPITLLAWIPLVVGLFTWFEPRRAVLIAYITGFLFLPQGTIEFSGFPELSRTAATSWGVIAGILLVDMGRLVRFRPSWVDLPMLMWCLAPLASSLSNQIGEYNGIYDGASVVLGQVLEWGIPYLAARLYFTNIKHLHELAMGILIGGIVYVPLCLFEIRMSPQLHNFVYGYHPTHFGMVVRLGGYRPMVFMQHGLMLGLWMSAASIVAIWLWYSRSYRQLFGVPSVLIMLCVVGTTVLSKSMGALVLLTGAMGLLFVARNLRMPALVYVAVAVAPIYMFLRVNDVWHGEQVIELAASFDQERAESLLGRLENESLLADRAMERPIFGWGQWGRWRVLDETGKDITVADGMWIITLGQMGLVGVISLTAALLLPIVLLVRALPIRLWATPAGGPAAALAAVLLIYMLDLLPNAMLSPMYLLIAGGLSSFCLAAMNSRAQAAYAQRVSRSRTRSPSRESNQHPAQHLHQPG